MLNAYGGESDPSTLLLAIISNLGFKTVSLTPTHTGYATVTINWDLHLHFLKPHRSKTPPAENCPEEK